MYLQEGIWKRTGLFCKLIVLATIVISWQTNFGRNAHLADYLYSWNLIKTGELWRLVTPIFLHFRIFGSVWFHIVFNLAIWVMYAGAVEYYEGKKKIFIFTLLASVISNSAQFYFSGGNFGGLSGVNFALIGYLFVQGRRNLFYAPVMRKESFYFFVIFMIFCWTGIFGAVANWAHLAGLLFGMLFAAIFTIRLL